MASPEAVLKQQIQQADGAVKVVLQEALGKLQAAKEEAKPDATKRSELMQKAKHVAAKLDRQTKIIEDARVLQANLVSELQDLKAKICSLPPEPLPDDELYVGLVIDDEDVQGRIWRGSRHGGQPCGAREEVYMLTDDARR